MTMTAAHQTTPTAHTTTVKGETKPQRTPRAEFMAAALSMSWQLAIVVLVPILGGFKLDQALHMTPLLTIVGFLLAMTGMGLVVWRQLQLFNPTVTQSDIANAKKIRDAEAAEEEA